MRAATEISLETLCAVTAEWPENLKACFEAENVILSDIIINENLKLLQINYLPRKFDILFNFLLGHIVLLTELIARLCRRRIFGVEEIDMNQV